MQDHCRAVFPDQCELCRLRFPPILGQRWWLQKEKAPSTGRLPIRRYIAQLIRKRQNRPRRTHQVSDKKIDPKTTGVARFPSGPPADILLALPRQIAIFIIRHRDCAPCQRSSNLPQSTRHHARQKATAAACALPGRPSLRNRSNAEQGADTPRRVHMCLTFLGCQPEWRSPKIDIQPDQYGDNGNRQSVERVACREVDIVQLQRSIGLGLLRHQ